MFGDENGIIKVCLYNHDYGKLFAGTDEGRIVILPLVAQSNLIEEDEDQANKSGAEDGDD